MAGAIWPNTTGCCGDTQTLLIGTSFLAHKGEVCDVFYAALTHLPLCRIYASVNNVSISSDNSLSPFCRQAIIQTNAGLLPIGPSDTKFFEIVIKVQNFSLTKKHLKTSSGKWRPFVQGDIGWSLQFYVQCEVISCYKHSRWYWELHMKFAYTVSAIFPRNDSLFDSRG